MATKQENDNPGLSFTDQTKIEEALRVILGAPDDISRENQEAIGVYDLKDKHLGDIISDDAAFTFKEAFVKVAYVIKLTNEKPAQPQKRDDRKQRRVG
jgi:hypothetical protein